MFCVIIIDKVFEYLDNILKKCSVYIKLKYIIYFFIGHHCRSTVIHVWMNLGL